jgi:hypothetical protein
MHEPNAADLPIRGRRYEPVLVEDFTQLDAAIAGFIGADGLAPSTRKRHRLEWRRWEDHCLVVGEMYRQEVDPHDAPMFAFEELTLLAREDGTPLARGTIEHIAAAVSRRYAEQGTDPAHKRPENASAWEELMRGLGNAEGRPRAAGDPPREQVTALLRAALRAMMSAPFATTSEGIARRAWVLLALDTEFTRTQLSRLTRDDVEVHERSVTVAGVEIVCDHEERVRGVPWDCTACAVRGRVQTLSPGEPLLGDALGRDRLRQLRRTWKACSTPDRPRNAPALVLQPGLSSWGVAGARRGLVLSVYAESWFVWLRGRAWTSVSWTCGLRMCSDLVRLPRAAAAPDADGRGYRLRLRGTKDDPSGAKQVERLILWSADAGTCAARALAEFLCVRDALAGVDGHLLVSSAGQRLSLLEAPKTAKKALNLLCRLASIEAVYSSYSTRRGFATQASLDGWDEEKIRMALRQESLDTTLLYVAAPDARAAVTKLLDAAA